MFHLDSINAAGRFLKQHGRDLDRCLFAYYFEEGSKNSVTNALAKYQNSDGGFGRALEPDVRMNHSSVLATTVAFQFMRPFGLPANDEIVRKGITYFLNTFNSESGGWQIVPPNVDDGPHAPWWKFNPDIKLQWANPRAEILGYLYEYESITPSDLREKLLNDVLMRLGEMNVLEMHEVQCFVRLLESPNLPASAKQTILSKINAMLPNVVELNAEKWDGYCLRPLDVVSSPNSVLFGAVEPTIDRNIQYIVKQQHPDGYWSPAWSWKSVDSEAWEQALKDLRSVITVTNALKVSSFSKAQ